MATRILTRSLLTPTKQTFDSLFTRSLTSLSLSKPTHAVSASTLSLLRLRPLVAVGSTFRNISLPLGRFRCFSTRPTTSSLNDPNPNWSNRPPKETILLDGCDFEHWLVVVEKPDESWTRDQIVDSYIKLLAQVVGSEEEARMKIYSVSTRHYFAFGALVSEELSYKIKELPGVRWVLPDSYLDVKNKDYGGEPFINGQAVPYDPKYHEEWVRNNARARERNSRNNRPRDRDRSRNFDRRPMQENRGAPPNMGPNNPGYAPPGNMGGMASNYAPNPQHGNAPNHGGAPYQSPSGPNPQHGNAPNHGGAPYQSPSGPNPNSYAPNMAGGNQYQDRMSGMPNNSPNAHYGNAPSSGGPYQPGHGPNQPGYAPNMAGGNPYQNSNASGMPNNAPNQQHGNGPYGGAPYQSGPGPNQNSYAPNMAGGSPYQNQNMPGRD